ncbi:MAG: four helix bundle protein [Anaerolineae bacterium]
MTKEKPFDIKERTFEFGVQVVRLVNTLPRTVAGVEVGRQLVKSGTSIGANMEEADGAESKRDFIHKVSIARKEARETRFWLRVVRATGLSKDAQKIDYLTQESDELVRILSAIIISAKRNDK